MLFRDVIALSSENCMKLISTNFGQNAKILMLKEYVVRIVTTGLKG
jgi:hypothetical protein